MLHNPTINVCIVYHLYWGHCSLLSLLWGFVFLCILAFHHQMNWVAEILPDDSNITTRNGNGMWLVLISPTFLTLAAHPNVFSLTRICESIPKWAQRLRSLGSCLTNHSIHPKLQALVEAIKPSVLGIRKSAVQAPWQALNLGCPHCLWTVNKLANIASLCLKWLTWWSLYDILTLSSTRSWGSFPNFVTMAHTGVVKKYNSDKAMGSERRSNSGNLWQATNKILANNVLACFLFLILQFCKSYYLEEGLMPSFYKTFSLWTTSWHVFTEPHHCRRIVCRFSALLGQRNMSLRQDGSSILGPW